MSETLPPPTCSSPRGFSPVERLAVLLSLASYTPEERAELDALATDSGKENLTFHHRPSRNENDWTGSDGRVCKPWIH